MGCPHPGELWWALNVPWQAVGLLVIWGKLTHADMVRCVSAVGPGHESRAGLLCVHCAWAVRAGWSELSATAPPCSGLHAPAVCWHALAFQRPALDLVADQIQLDFFSSLFEFSSCFSAQFLNSGHSPAVSGADTTEGAVTGAAGEYLWLRCPRGSDSRGLMEASPAGRTGHTWAHGVGA